MDDASMKVHKSSFIVYLLLVNSFTWLCWIPGLLIGAQQGFTMPGFNTFPGLFAQGFSSSQHRFLSILFMLGVYGPLVGGLVATWMDTGKSGVAAWWQSIIRFQINGRWYALSLLLSFLMPAVPVAIFLVIGGFSRSTFTLSYVVLFLIYQFFTSGLGEEPGWRGFLMPRLQTRSKDDNYVWVMGLIWAVWHYPLVVLQGISSMPEVTVIQAVIMQLLSLAGFTMSIIGISYLYAWFYNQTQSVFLLIVFHALTNTFNSWFITFLDVAEPVTLFIALTPWVVVLILQKRLGKSNFPG